ncbi:M16 family metallopeptidase [Luteibaculum oceani]|nr:pitrilysin family protein [Luteibaculum oceani]
MKLKYLSLMLAPLLLWNCEGNKKMEGYTMIEEVKKQGDEIVIPYKKFELDNGLTVLVHEDNSDPVVHVDVTYHVGSAREEIGRSGFAHFFEHMMFQGSDHVADEEHFKTVTEAGGTLNGTTNRDRTNYFETLPANQLEIALWLEADRMGWLLDAVTQEKFEIQRATVKNERGQNYDNRPYGMLGEIANQALFPHGHPYSWPTIGYINELNEATLDDLKDFFLRWYGPNNATLTVAGDVSADQVMELAKKYFGPINRGPEVEDMPEMPAKLDADRYISHEDKIRFPLLQMNFPTVANRHKDEAALDILSDILGGGKTSIFYQEFVKSGKYLQASVSNPCSELAGNMSFTLVAFPGTNLKDTETQLRAAIDKFEERGVTDEDLQRYKASFEASTIQRLSSVRGKGSMLASFQTFTGNANYIKEDIARYMNVTKEDVLRVYNEYIKGKPAVIVSYVPEGQLNLIAAEDNYTPTIGRTDETVLNNYDSLSYQKPVDNFDRSVKPEPGPAPFVQVPEFWTVEMDNGIKGIGTETDEVPTVSIQITLPAGHRNETIAKAGISSLMAGMMNEGTKNFSAEQMSEELEKLGSRVSVSSGAENITVNISTLTKNLDKTLELAKEVILMPAFKEEDFARLKKQALEAIANRENQASQLASDAYARLSYGENHIKAVPSAGTKASVSAMTLEDVKAYYNRYFSPKGAKLVVVGNLSKDEILPKLDFLKEWTGEAYEWPKQPELAGAEPGKIYFMNKEGAAQSEIRIGYMNDLTYDPTGEYYKATIMNYQLGGNFNSRININLREDKGYTYGARSFFRAGKEPGGFLAYAGVKKEATDSSLYEFLYEINTYAESGITDEELAFVKKSLTQSEALDYETPFQKAGFLRRILDYNLEPGYVKTQSEILQNISAEEIHELAKKHLPTEKMIMVIVGDKKTVWEGINKLGFDVVEIDKDGAII